AEKLKEIRDLDELKKYEKEVISQYADFVDYNFGILDDYDEYDSELTTCLYVAYDWKRKSLYPENKNYPPTCHVFERFFDDYVKYLDSLHWTEWTFGKRIKDHRGNFPN
ncbi:hypothetical protein IJ135_01990, partial [Candidatus Saccharibacteria bacterium]|nr:hypothetical protein [Candidatus Saccharibacteria bacterium]